MGFDLGAPAARAVPVHGRHTEVFNNKTDDTSF